MDKEREKAKRLEELNYKINMRRLKDSKAWDPHMPGSLTLKGRVDTAKWAHEQIQSLEKEKEVLLQELAESRKKSYSYAWHGRDDTIELVGGVSYLCCYVFGDFPEPIEFYGVLPWATLYDNGYVKGPHFANEGVNGMRVTRWMHIPGDCAREDVE